MSGRRTGPRHFAVNGTHWPAWQPQLTDAREASGGSASLPHCRATAEARATHFGSVQ